VQGVAEGGVGAVVGKEGGHPGDDRRLAQVGFSSSFLCLFSYKCTCFVSCFVNTSIFDNFLFCYMRDEST
jgi:hypothetical protein